MMGKVFRIGFWIGVGLLFVCAFWLRVTSLETMPLPDSDEIWFTQQILHAVNGQPFETMTPSGNPMVLVQAPVIAPLLLLWPSGSVDDPSGLGGRRVAFRVSHLPPRAPGPRSNDGPDCGGGHCCAPVRDRSGPDGLRLQSDPDVRHPPLLLRVPGSPSSVSGCSSSSTISFIPRIFSSRPACVPYSWLGRSRSIAQAGRAPQWRRVVPRVAVLLCITLGLGLHKMHQPQTRSACEAYHLGLAGPHQAGHFLLSIAKTLMATKTLPVPWGEASRSLSTTVLFGAALIGLIGFGTPSLDSCTGVGSRRLGGRPARQSVWGFSLSAALPS